MFTCPPPPFLFLLPSSSSSIQQEFPPRTSVLLKVSSCQKRVFFPPCCCINLSWGGGALVPLIRKQRIAQIQSSDTSADEGVSDVYMHHLIGMLSFCKDTGGSLIYFLDHVVSASSLHPFSSLVLDRFQLTGHMTDHNNSQ